MISLSRQTTSGGDVAMMRSLTCFLSVLVFSPLAFADLESATRALAGGDYATAAREFQALADQGNPRAQANLGYMYYVGEGVPQSYAEAVNWYRKAAIQGDRDAQYNLAVAYAFGEGITQNFAEAATWYRRAADQGHVLAQYSMGISHAYGEGVNQDAREAVRWFAAAAEQGYDRAQVQLGSKYHTGDGVAQNYQEAARWYRMAADRGNAAAQFNLGTLYRSGTGVEKDYNQAMRWFRLAADQGYASAQNELASLERAMAGASRTRATGDLLSPPPVSRPAPAVAQPTPSPAPAPAPAPEPTPAMAETPPATVADSSAPVAVTTAAEETERPSRLGFIRNIFRRDREDAPADAETSAATVEDRTGEAETGEPLVSETEQPEEALPAPEAAPVEMEAEEVAEGERPSRFGFIRNIFKRSDSGEEPAAVEEPESPPEEVAEVEPEPEPVAEPETAAVTEEEEQRPGLLARLFRRGNTEEPETEAEIAEPTTESAMEELPAPPAEPLEEPEPAAEEGPQRPGLIARLFNRDAREAAAGIPEETEDSDVSSIGYADRDVEFTASADQVDTARMALLERDYPKAFEEFSTLANQGDRASQYELASLYYQGLGAEQSYTEAAYWYQRAAEQGDKDSQYSLGNMYLMGEGIEQSDVRAAYWYEQAAEQGHEEARHNLNNIAKVKEIAAAPPERVEGEASLEEAAGETVVASGEKPARPGFFRNIFKRDKDKSQEPEEAPAPPAIAEAAETRPGTAAEDGEEKKGFFKRWFGKDEESETAAATQVATAAADDTARAMTILEGNATPEQETRVIAIADYEKGMTHSFGEGVAKDSNEAFRWFLKSAEQGYAPAQYKVGVAYAYGDGIAQDPVEAAVWYRKAALQGYALAQRNLGTMYAQGEGMDIDRPLAFAWYSVLAQSGNVMDIRRRDQLQSELSQEEYQRALEIKESLLGSIKAGAGGD